mgnify:CR=1 FL=1
MATVKLKDKLEAAKRDMSDLNKDLDHHTSVKVYIGVVITSCIVWAIVSLMAISIFFANELIFDLFSSKEFEYPFLFFFFIIVFVAIVRSYLYTLKSFKDSFGDGASEAIHFFHETYHDRKDTKRTIQQLFKMPSFFGKGLRRALITFMTIGVGGSGGLEGPAIPIGVSFATGVIQRLGINDFVWVRVIQMCGISSAVTTLLHAPLTGCIFASELVFGGRFVYRTLMYSMISSLIAYVLTNHLIAAEPIILVQPHTVNFSFMEYIYVIFVSLMVSVPSGLGLIIVFRWIKEGMSYFPTYLHASFGATMCVLLALILWHFFQIEPTHILGVGEGTIEKLITQQPDVILTEWRMLFLIVIVKIILTGFTIVSGGSAGLLIPAVFVGAATSSGLFYFLNEFGLIAMLPGIHDVFVVAGVASSLICIMDLPIATIILMAEIFGMSFAPVAILAVGLSRSVANYYKSEFLK